MCMSTVPRVGEWWGGEPGSYRVRRAEPCDADAVAAWSGAEPDPYLRSMIMGVAETTKKPPRFHVVFAIERRAREGTIEVVGIVVFLDGADHGTLNNIYLPAAVRARGLGTAATAVVFSDYFARQPNGRHVTMHEPNDASERMWVRLRGEDRRGQRTIARSVWEQRSSSCAPSWFRPRPAGSLCE
jgi:hypothetical protein